MTARGSWQEDAWKFIEAVGELQYYVSWQSNSVSRCRMVASALDDNGAPTGTLLEDDPNAETVRQIVSDIAGGAAGQAKILKRAAYLLAVVGECWIGLVVRDPAREESNDGNMLPVDITRPGFQLEQWFVFGQQQIGSSANTIELKLPDGTKHEFNPDVDILFRVWSEHPADPSLPVSPIWSNRAVLHEIVQSTATIDNANKSRLIGNGLLFVPQEMSLPQQTAPVALPSGETDSLTPTPFFEPNTAQTLQDLLFDVASTAVREPDSLASMLPIVAGVPGEQTKNIQWLRPATEVPETALKTRTDAIRRLAMGLDVAPERLLGMGANSNHWSAALIDDGDVKVHVAPMAELICSAFTQEILREKLADEGIDPSQYIVWYDTTGLTQDPDKTDEAKDGFDRGAISGRALREHLGFDDEDGYDLESSDGWIELALDKIALDPANAAVFMPILQAAAEKVGLEIREPQAALPAAPDAQPEDQPPVDDTQPPEPAQPPADSAPASVNAAAMTVARLCVNRALELANKRRRTRSNAELFRDVPIEKAHLRLEPVQMCEVDELIRGWATGVSDADLMAMELEPSAFRSMVGGIAAICLVTSTLPVVTSSMLRRMPRVPA
jgi:hypothetical protein